MPTTTKTIKPAGGGDFSTLALALAGTSSDTNDVVFNCFAGNIMQGGAASIPSYAAASLTINAIDRHLGSLVTTLTAVSNMQSSFMMSGTLPIVISGMTIASFATVGGYNASNITYDSCLVESTAAISTGNEALNYSQCILKNCAFYGGALYSAKTLNSTLIGTAPSTSTLMVNCSIYSTIVSNFSQAFPTFSTFCLLSGINCASLSPSTGVGGFRDLPGGRGGTEKVSTSLINCCYNKVTINGPTTNPQISGVAAEFVSASDLRSLNSASKIRGNGTSTSAPPLDIIGGIRPQNNLWDIGAFQFMPVATGVINFAFTTG